MKKFWQMLKDKAKTVWWFIRNRQHGSFLLTLLKRRLFKHPKENTEAEAKAWCQEKAISTNEFLKKTGIGHMTSIRDKFPAVFEKAEKRSARTPVKMGGKADLDLLYALSEYCQAHYILETGVAYGWSSLALLLSIHARGENICLFSTDMPYPKMNNEDFVGCVVPDELKKSWKLFRFPDETALKKIFRKQSQFDLAHYDSDKSYAGRMKSYPLIWKHLRSGGFFISDDIGDNVAFKEFAALLNQPYYVVFEPEEEKYVGVIEKK